MTKEDFNHKELLLRAAGAAGIKLLRWLEPTDENSGWWVALMNAGTESQHDVYWDPINYNDEALELVGLLGLQLTVDHANNTVHVAHIQNDTWETIQYDAGGDPMPAVRLAIVKLAARLGPQELTHE